MLLADRAAGVAVERDLLRVSPEEGGIVIVGMTLAVVAEEVIEALFLRVAGRVVHAEAPLADHAGDVTEVAQKAGDGDGPFRDRQLAVGFRLAVVADVGVSRMQPGHEDAARRSADGIAGVMLGEAQPLRRHLVEARRANFLLPVAAELGVTEIVGHDEDDVRLARFARVKRSRERACGDEREESALHDLVPLPSPRMRASFLGGERHHYMTAETNDMNHHAERDVYDEHRRHHAPRDDLPIAAPWFSPSPAPSSSCAPVRWSAPASPAGR